MNIRVSFTKGFPSDDNFATEKEGKKPGPVSPLKRHIWLSMITVWKIKRPLLGDFHLSLEPKMFWASSFNNVEVQKSRDGNIGANGVLIGTSKRYEDQS